MSGNRERIPDEALDSHDPGELTFAQQGPAIMGLGKEALLTRLTTRRTHTHHAVIDYIFKEAEDRNAHVYTTTHVLAEVVGTIRSGEDSETVDAFWNDIQDSSISVLEDGRGWDDPLVDDDGNPAFQRPFEQFNEVQQLYNENPDIDFKFHEATLGLNGVLLEELSDGSYTVYIATFDGALAALCDELELEVLPYRTDLRDDASYR